MNWYKRAQQLEIVDSKDIEGKQKHYTDVAHDISMEEANRMLGYEDKNYSIDNPNIMWIYNNGNIETKPETNRAKTHRDPLAWGNATYLDRLYTGRYSPSKKIITIIPPHTGVSQFRDIPENIKYLLKQTFPEANQLYVYSNSEKNIKISKIMNWCKKAQQNDILKENPYYIDIGHGKENDNLGSDMDVIWISDLNGDNFNLADPTNYEHEGLAYDVGLNQQIGTIQGRYDWRKNIVSINVDPSIATMNKLPNRLINRLYREFGNDITILDYSHGLPKRIV